MSLVSGLVHRAQSRKIMIFKNFLRILLDAAVYTAAFTLAYCLRFDGIPPEPHLEQLIFLLSFVVIARVVVNLTFGVYRSIWRYVSLNDIVLLLLATSVPTAVMVLGRIFLSSQQYIWRVPYSVSAIEFLLAVAGASALRMLRRVWFETSEGRATGAKPKAKPKVRVLLVGAGMAGVMVAKEAKKGKNLNWRVVGFIDDDPKKLKTSIHGLNVLGRTADIPMLVGKCGVDRVIITIANASSKDIRRIVETCEAVPVPVKIIPAMFEILDDRVSINRLRDVAIDDLLGREVVNFGECPVNTAQDFRGKRILVTGAGGSIGSEICRQLCTFSPSELLLLDKDENGVYELDSELGQIHCHVARKIIICDIRDFNRLSSVLNLHKPQVIFHAAAHKHVPLMEDNPVEAVTTNIEGTLNLLKLTEHTECERFVMLSTDKAVNPTSLMGATKRAAELMIQSFSSSTTLFSCVRFGNVLGSRGSVVPLFQAQIRRGGPLTLTDRNVVRFFMTIPEAVQLVIQAATLGCRGEIFVLDMGKPVKIVDLAKDLIRLSGLKEGEIEIVYTGLRPGEKSHEELFYSFERAAATKFPKIVSVAPIAIEFDGFWQCLEGILAQHRDMDDQALRQSIFNLIQDVIPTEMRSQQTALRPVKKFGRAEA